VLEVRPDPVDALRPLARLLDHSRVRLEQGDERIHVPGVDRLGESLMDVFRLRAHECHLHMLVRTGVRFT
jgi:hypothetical protein